MEERIQKILAQWGIASRREAEKLIRNGRVQLNGQTAHLGQKANPQSDRLTVDGQEIRSNNRPSPVYLLLNKPAGVVSTCRDPQQRRTVLDLLPAQLRRGQGVHPVGRLDTNSTGALLLTNDGELTLHLTHPRYHLPKTYRVWVRGEVTPGKLQRWRQGVMLPEGKTLPAKVKVLHEREDETLLEIVLEEGKNRQIRRVAALLGLEVIALDRLAIASIRLQSLPRGQYRHLSDREIRLLKQQYPRTLDAKHHDEAAT